MSVLRFIYDVFSYVIMFPWVLIKLIAFVVFMISLGILAGFYILCTFDLEGVQTLFKGHLNKELKTLFNGL